MKPIAARRRKSSELPIAWCEAGYAALGAYSADSFDDRVSEDIFDVEDEQEEVSLIVQQLAYGPN
jgi:hypothetical protein